MGLRWINGSAGQRVENHSHHFIRNQRKHEIAVQFPLVLSQDDPDEYVSF